MSWTPSPTKKGGLKGGYRLDSENSCLTQTLPSISPSRSLHLKSSSTSNSPKNISSNSASSKESPIKDLIKASLKQQFSSSSSSSSSAVFDGALTTDVQRILSESIDFITGDSQQSGLLLGTQKNCTDVSEVPVTSRFTFTSYSSSGGGSKVGKKSGMLTGDAKQNDVSQFKSPLRSNSNVKNTPQATPTLLSPTKKTNAVEEQLLPEPKLNFYDVEKVKLGWQGVAGAGAGLHNMGNTCFLNATLQCLAYTPALYNFLQDDHKKNCRVSATAYCIICKLQDLLLQMVRTKNGPLRPLGISQNIKVFAKTLSIGRQEDAHEFLRFVVEAMRKTALQATGYDVKKLDTATQETTFASRIFGGFYRSRVKCLNCQHASNVYDPFLDVPLDIAKVKSLLEALRSFTRPEELNVPGNLYKCERCRKLCFATKQTTIHRAPNVLTVQLKRFLFSGFVGSSGSSGFAGSSGFQKIDKLVEFPEVLDLKPFVSEGEAGGVGGADGGGGGGLMYRLYAVLVHSGASCHSGHYFAFVRTANNTWSRMDDTSVFNTGLQTVLSQRAYLLFYTRDPSLSSNGKSLSESALSSSLSVQRAVIHGPVQQIGKGKEIFFQKSANGTVNGMPNGTAKGTVNGTGNGTATPAGELLVNRVPVVGPSPRPNGVPMQLLPRQIDIKNRLNAVTAKLPAGSPAKTPAGNLVKTPAGSPVKMPAGNLPASLVPYADDEEEEEAGPSGSGGSVQHPEPTSRGSSTSSSDSVKENKESGVSKSASPKRSAGVAFAEEGLTGRDGGSPSKLSVSPMKMSVSPEKSEQVKLSVSPMKLSVSPEKSELVPAKLSVSPTKFSVSSEKSESVGESLPAGELMNEPISGGVSSVSEEVSSSSSSSKGVREGEGEVHVRTVDGGGVVLSKKAAKKLRKELLKEEKRKSDASLLVEGSSGKAKVSTPLVGEELEGAKGTKKKRKKKKSRRGRDEEVELTNSLVWVEKDAVEKGDSDVSPPTSEKRGGVGQEDSQPVPVTTSTMLPPPPLLQGNGDNRYHHRSSSPQRAEIRSWSGGQSLLEQEEEASRNERRKRHHETATDTYDEEFDVGRSKKFKSKSQFPYGGGGTSYRNQNGGGGSYHQNGGGDGYQRNGGGNGYQRNGGGVGYQQRNGTGGGNAFQRHQNYRIDCDARSKSVTMPRSSNSDTHRRPYPTP